METDNGLVPGRVCGECSACCVHLRIDTKELQKQAGVPCPHLEPGRGCGIHDHWPRICREWFCGWRQFDYLPESMRPDKSGVIVQLEGGEFVLNAIASAEAYLSDPVLQLIGVAIDGGVPIYITTPSKPGQVSWKLHLNPKLAAAVGARDKASVRAGVVKMLEYGAGLTSPERP